MKRGDVIIVARGKPRPAIIVQSDSLLTPEEVVICPMTTHIADAPLYRPTIAPNTTNGLQQLSQVMADKVVTARRDKIGKTVGHLDERDMMAIDDALRFVLELAGA